MQRSPYETPKHAVAGNLPYPPLRRVALAQRQVVIALCMQTLLVLLNVVAISTRHVAPVVVVWLTAPLVILFSMFAAVLLGVRLKQPLVTVLCSIATLCSPLFGILGLLWINKRAASYLRMNGVAVGFWGARKADLQSPQFPPQGTPGTVSGSCQHCGLETTASFLYEGVTGPCRLCGKQSTFRSNGAESHNQPLKPYDEGAAKWNYLWRWHRDLFTPEEVQAAASPQYNNAARKQATARIEAEHASQLNIAQCAICDCILPAADASNCRWCGYAE